MTLCWHKPLACCLASHSVLYHTGYLCRVGLLGTVPAGPAFCFPSQLWLTAAVVLETEHIALALSGACWESLALVWALFRASPQHSTAQDPGGTTMGRSVLQCCGTSCHSALDSCTICCLFPRSSSRSSACTQICLHFYCEPQMVVAFRPCLPFCYLMSGKASIFSEVLAVKPHWLMPKETQCFSLKAKGGMQSYTAILNSTRRGDTAKKYCCRGL